MRLEKYVKMGERIGLSEVEIAVRRISSISIDVEMGEIKGATSIVSEHLIVRGLIGKRLGLYHSDRVDETELEKAIKRVYEIARNNQPDERWVSLPDPAPYGEEVSWDREISETPPERYVEFIERAFKLVAERDPRALIAFASSGCSYGFVRILNSRGVDFRDSDGISAIGIGLIGSGEGISTPLIMGFSFSRTVRPGVEAAVEEALLKLKHAYRAKRGKTEEADVIMDPRALEELLRFTLIPAIAGENVVRGKSPLAGKIGSKIASEVLTIMEDPSLPNAFSSARGDDEGIPTSKKVIIEGGVLRTFIWDNYWAKVKGVKPTGNGFRNWQSGSVSTRPTNLVIKPGEKTLEDLIGEVRRGYYVAGLQGAHSSNPDTGDFSVVANPAFLIEDGEIKGLALGVMLVEISTNC